MCSIFSGNRKRLKDNSILLKKVKNEKFEDKELNLICGINRRLHSNSQAVLEVRLLFLTLPKLAVKHDRKNQKSSKCGAGEHRVRVQIQN